MRRLKALGFFSIANTLKATTDTYRQSLVGCSTDFWNLAMKSCFRAWVLIKPGILKYLSITISQLTALFPS